MDPSEAGCRPTIGAPGCGDSAAGPSRSLTEDSSATATATATAMLMEKHRQPQVASRGSWWDRWFAVQHDPAASVIKTRCRGLGLCDGDVVPLCLALGGLLLHAVGPERPAILDLDMSENHLTDQGGVILMKRLLEFAAWHGGGLRLRVLKLFKNQLSDATLVLLARLVTKQPEAIDEIHLSHNLITQRGAAALLVAIACHPFRNYPQSSHLGPCPCWIRMERNLIVDVDGLLSCAELPPVQLSWCSAPRGKKGSNCSSYFCSAVAQGKLPQVHLFCFREQSEGAERGRSKAQESIAHFSSLASQGWPEAVADVEETAATMAEGRAGAATANDTVEPPTKDGQLRTVVLRVDEEKGAGLELEASLYGMVVSSLEDEPGQPELKVGDVIVCIDGVPLWGMSDEDVLETEFGSHFRDGSRLEVACFESIQWRAVVQRLPNHPDFHVHQHSAIMLDALQEDLRILGGKCGGATLAAVDKGLHIRGSPPVQRCVIEALPDLLCFYFPSLQGGHALPAPEWTGDVDDLCKWVEVDQTHQEATMPTFAAVSAEESRPPACPDDGGQGGDQEQEQEQEQDLDDWEESRRKQWDEEQEAADEYFDLDYFEVLDAPDEGPDVFEGDVIPLTNYNYDLERPMRMLILVGLPGSGKSTLAARLEPMGWAVINQDTLGDRKACVATARRALEKGRPVVIDRCNVSRTQRKVWLGIADEFSIGVGCLWLDLGTELCGQRVLQRFKHPTLPATASSLKVIRDFAEHLEPPAEAEGLVLWRATSDQEVETALMDCIDLHLYFSPEETQQPVGSSYFSSSQAAADDNHHSAAARSEPVQHQQQSHPSSTFVRSFSRSTSARSGGQGQDRRSGRALYLRDLRRQIEYYFGDKNLKRDWFLQEKINSPPLEGWLEIRWLLSCPRVQNYFRASEQDIVEALSASGLLVNEAYGTYWVSRARDLPKLLERRPELGEEPHWYQLLHESQLAEAAAAAATHEEEAVLLKEEEEEGASGGGNRKSEGVGEDSDASKKKGNSKVAEWLMAPAEGKRVPASTADQPATESSGNLPQGISKVAAWLMAPTEGVGCTTGSPSTWLSNPQAATDPPAPACDSQRATCDVCKRSLPRGSFSKAQLTKNRRHPICKDCVNHP